MHSSSARQCLNDLGHIQLTDRENLSRLNDQFVDVIENVHYMEAEHSALMHDYNLLKSGIQSDSIGINEIYETEIRHVRIGVDEVNRNRQQLLNEQSHLSQQVKEAEQQWRHISSSALGVPKDVDDDFVRICQIKMENCIMSRRIKYMDDKNKVTKQNNGRIFEQINLMRMRTDQAVSLQHEYRLRKNDLLQSIRNLEEDNKKIIMNEHKYFTRDRNTDRHAFRDQLRQGLADIRANYESTRLRNQEEIRLRLERELARINAVPIGGFGFDKLREELAIVKSNLTGMQQQVSAIEVRNATLTQQIEFLRLEISESSEAFEINLAMKSKEIENIKEQCTAISIELEVLCDCNLDLNKEIAKYRELLDRSGRIEDYSLRTTTNVSTWTPTPVAPAIPRYTPTPVAPTYTPTPAIPDYTPTPIPKFTPTPISAPAPIGRFTPTPEPTPIVHPAPVQPYTPYPVVDSSYNHSAQSSTYERIGSVVGRDRYHEPVPLVPITPIPQRSAYNPYDRVATSPYSHTPYDRTYGTEETVVRPNVDVSISRTGSGRYERNNTQHIIGTEASNNTQHIIGTGASKNTQHLIGTGVTGLSATQSVIGHRDSRTAATGAAIGTGVTGFTSSHTAVQNTRTGGPYSHQVTDSLNSISTSATLHRTSSPLRPVPQTAPVALNDVENSSSFDSVDEDYFQRFTRWYKGRVKISDVTPDYVQIVNRSAKKSIDIGRFKLIHEYGARSVYVDLPASFILGPKECLKIYARKANYEHGSVVAEIDHFDTSIHTNTSIRNTNNEVKSWFVYTSNSEIGDSDHHHH